MASIETSESEKLHFIDFLIDEIQALITGCRCIIISVLTTDSISIGLSFVTRSYRLRDVHRLRVREKHSSVDIQTKVSILHSLSNRNTDVFGHFDAHQTC